MVLGHTNADTDIREYRIKDIDISADNQNIDIWLCLNIYILWYPGSGAAPWCKLLSLQQCLWPQQHRTKAMS